MLDVQLLQTPIRRLLFNIKIIILVIKVLLNKIKKTYKLIQQTYFAKKNTNFAFFMHFCQNCKTCSFFYPAKCKLSSHTNTQKFKMYQAS